MIDADALLADTKTLVRSLVDDLRATAGIDPDSAAVVDREYARAHGAGRTALAKAEWAEGLYAQVAVAWVLGAVFVRFCEDNSLEPEPLLAGPGPRRAIALDHRSAHLRANPAHDDRHWLREIFTRYRALPATGDVFGDHNPIWLLAPSADGARQLVQQLQEIDPDAGELRHDFTDPAWDTRFLGDLYQDLSEHAKKTYALLQTPVFVEEFILDRTLEPALATFGLRETTAIDPTCGSGHFLLGVFARLFERWVDAEPGTNRRELARRALDAIGGVDLNPFAASIARFRLLVAALRAGGDTRLADAPAYPIHVAVGDSLLHGDPPGRLAGTSVDDEVAGAAAHGYATEDVEQARELLSRSWTVVVGNPPYITVKDRALNALYRARFKTCHRQYSLGVPFTERFFQLARYEGEPERAGYVGMITANSFMQREFGRKLVQDWVPSHDLTALVDTKFADIPGHNQTVILFGRNRRPVGDVVRTVMAIRGQADQPQVPEKGHVWSSILESFDEPGFENDYISVVDLDRSRLSRHPWTLGGGGAAELKELLDTRGRTQLTNLVAEIGASVVTREDELFALGAAAAARNGINAHLTKRLAAGEDVRDWRVSDDQGGIWPYDEQTLRPAPDDAMLRFLWRWRAQLAARVAYGKTQVERGLEWFEYSMFFRDRYRNRRSIAYAEVATHNHFVFVDDDGLFRQTAPVIKLRREADDSRYHELLAVLNSSTACFWLKQACYNKSSSHGGGAADAPFTNQYAFDATKMASLPVPAVLQATSASLLCGQAQQLAEVFPASGVGRHVPTAGLLADAQGRHSALRAEMVATQERLDWEVYRLYGLVDEDLTTGEEQEPPLQLGERAFEFVLSRKMAAGEEESSWFARHRSTPITELPTHWPESYRRLVERRIELIETDLNIGLIEKPEYKRRWAAKSWDEQVNAALRGWLLDRLEDRRYWPEPAAITTTARLAAEARTDEEFLQVARLYAGRDDVDVAALVAELVKAEAVPYLAALRFKESGMRKHAQWLETWELQRGEDAGEDVGAIPVPPKYAKADFTGVAWDHRGKLDVPKERFVSYPGAEREADTSLPVGWAGWDYLARARALATWYLQAKRDGRDVAHLTPLLAGLAELVPWLKQWHDEPNPDPALDQPGTQIAALVESELRALHLTADDLTAWRPEPPRRGRRARS